MYWISINGAQTLLIQIITLDGFSLFHSSFVDGDGFTELGHVKQKQAAGEKEGSSETDERLKDKWTDGPTG